LVSVFSLVLISSRFAPSWGGAAARLVLLAAWIAIWRLARGLLG
jgi:hypothetical protein